MSAPASSNLQERVVLAAETVLKRYGSVGFLELLQEMRLLQPVHFECWRKGNEHYRVLEEWILVRDKIEKVLARWSEADANQP